MAKCKTCGTEAASPRKKWVMAGRADKTGKKTQLEIGLFDCTKCKKNLPHYPKQKEDLRLLETDSTPTPSLFSRETIHLF
jgi:hypothetical protein